MKSYFFTFILTVLFLATTFTASLAQIEWTKYDDPATTNPPYAQSDPVWGIGLPGELISPFVYFDGITYNMWYGDYDGTNIRISLATSTDGINWTDSTNNPVLEPGPNGSWDDQGVGTGSVLFDGTTYHLWYDGYNAGIITRIGYATSLNRVNWTKDTLNPVLDVDPPVSWDDDFVGLCCVIIDNTDSKYKMWYTGGSSALTGDIGYATSLLTALEEIDTKQYPNGFTLKQNYPNPFNPVTMINYQLPRTNHVELTIYNLLGQKVATLVSGKQKAGDHQVAWYASGFASGVYYYQLMAGEYKDVKKMILFR